MPILAVDIKETQALVVMAIAPINSFLKPMILKE